MLSYKSISYYIRNKTCNIVIVGRKHVLEGKKHKRVFLKRKKTCDSVLVEKKTSNIFLVKKKICNCYFLRRKFVRV